MELMSSFKASLNSQDILRLPLVVMKGLEDLKNKAIDNKSFSKSEDNYEQEISS